MNSVPRQMEKSNARQKAIDHLTALVADCTEAIVATDIWADYPPKDRIRSIALFHETRDVARRLLANLQAAEPIARTDWQRVMPHEEHWTLLYKIICAQTQHEGNNP